MQCPKCNLEISEDSKFCPNCGVEISKCEKESLEPKLESSIVKSDAEKKYDYYRLLNIDSKIIERDKQIGENKYLRYNPAEYKAEISNSDTIGCNAILTFIVLLISSWFICAIQRIENAFRVSVTLSLIITVIYIVYALATLKPQDTVDILKKLKNRVDEHNKNFITSTASKLLEENGVETVSKEIMLTRTIDHIEKIVVDESSSTFLLVDVNCTCPTSRTFTQKALFSEILRYEVIDRTTQTQTATSTTSSNSGKALGGAVVSKLLINDAATGAVIGGSGKRTTQTTYKTTTHEYYNLNIYLNRLEDSIIRINTSSRNNISEIVSVLEFILNNKGE